MSSLEGLFCLLSKLYSLTYFLSMLNTVYKFKINIKIIIYIFIFVPMRHNIIDFSKRNYHC